MDSAVVAAGRSRARSSLALVVGDPGAIDRRSKALRGLSIALVAVLVAGSLASTGLLIAALIEGSSATNSAGELLATGAIVWVSNNIAFSLLYWELDGGGAAARAHRLPRYPDFAFPQQLNPDLAPPNWRPASTTTSTSASRMPPRSARRTPCRSRSGPSSR